MNGATKFINLIARTHGKHLFTIADDGSFRNYLIGWLYGLAYVTSIVGHIPLFFAQIKAVHVVHVLPTYVRRFTSLGRTSIVWSS